MNLRKENIAKLESGVFDALILGGGINGAVSAAALAGKGLRVALIDKGDFAGVTSSSSSNLIWGGIKYMESGEFLLVNKLCRSRNHLMSNYPSSVKEIRFLAAIERHFRVPAFFIYLGALLYWFIGRFFTKAPRYLTARAIKREERIINIDNIAGGVEYSDGFLPDNDARFVFNFVRISMDYGCVAANYVEALRSKRENGQWVTNVRDAQTDARYTVRSKVLINACGPYVDHYNRVIGQTTEHRHVLSKGIHLVVDRLTDSNKVLAFFASDGRLFFVLPMGSKTCIGTTDTPVDSPETAVTDEDRDFVLSNVNRLLDLAKPLTKSDVVAERCGVRPLVVKGSKDVAADWMKLSRKHAIEVNEDEQFVSIFGGKLTDCINVGNEVAEVVAKTGVKLSRPDEKWYGEPGADKKAAYLRKAESMDLNRYTPESFVEPLTERLWRRYGERAMSLLQKIEKNPLSATKLIDGIRYLRCEIELAAETEMVTKLEDFLRRRTKVSYAVRHAELVASPGLKELSDILFGNDSTAKLNEYLDGQAVDESLGIGRA